MAGEAETTAQTTTEAPELPESTDVHGAARLMDGLADDGGGEQEERADTANANEEGGDTVETEEASEDREADTDETQETEAAGDAPQFWDAEDREAYKQLPPTAKAIVLKYEQKRVAFEQEKGRETAQVRAEARQVVERAAGFIEQGAAWWQQNGPAFQQAFADRWSQVDWNKLAADNPAEWTRLKQQRDHEATLLIEANRRGEAEMAVANNRTQRKFAETKQAQHDQLAKKLPQFFGPDVAAKTYKDLGDFLVSKGLPADRINAIHEAPIIELALAAMRFEQAQKQASGVTNRKDPVTGKFTASTTPTRVAPGPTARAGGDQRGEAARRVGERFRKSGGASIADAAELIRLNDL
jgi:hypothetical protein